jgi:hypothetical protein
LLVKARSDSGGPVRGGTVIIDDEPRGQLVNGRLTVTEVDEGRHTVAINVGGFRRFAEIVTVRGGEQATLDAQLHGLPAAAVERPLPGAGGSPPPETPSLRPSGLWKVSLAAGAATAAVGGGYALYAFERRQSWLPKVPSGIGPGECGEDRTTLLTKAPTIDFHAFDRTCHFHTRIYVGYAIAGVGAAAAIVSLIMLTRDPVASDGHAAGEHARLELAIAPLIAPDLAGAQLAVAW